MANHIEAGRKLLRQKNGGPHRKTIVAGAARGAIFDDGISHADAEIDAIGERVAKAATVHDEIAGIHQPQAGLGVFNPKTRDAGTRAEKTGDAVVLFAIVAIV